MKTYTDIRNSVLMQFGWIPLLIAFVASPVAADYSVRVTPASGNPMPGGTPIAIQTEVTSLKFQIENNSSAELEMKGINIFISASRKNTGMDWVDLPVNGLVLFEDDRMVAVCTGISGNTVVFDNLSVTIPPNSTVSFSVLVIISPPGDADEVSIYTSLQDTPITLVQKLSGSPVTYELSGPGGAENVYGVVEMKKSGSLTPTHTHTPVPPTPTHTDTPVPPTPTHTDTPVPPTSTHTPTPVPPTPTHTPTPEPTKRKESGSVTKGDSKTTMDDAEPINMATGEYYFTLDLMNLGGIFPLDYRLYYGSQVDSKRARDGFPFRFIGNHRIMLERYKLDPEPDKIFVELGLGEEVGFHEIESGWEVFDLEGIRYQLKETTDYYYFLDPSKELIYILKKHGDDESTAQAFLVYIQDRNGNMLTYENPDGDTIETRGPDRIYDGLGRELRFTYENVTYQDQQDQITAPFLTKIEDQNGRTVTFTYEANPEDNLDGIALRSITYPGGNSLTFSYAGRERIASKTLPRGNTPYTQTYNDSFPFRGVVATQTDAYGNTSTITPDQYAPYVEDQSQFSITYADGAKRAFQHDHNSTVVKSVTDTNGKNIEFQSDPTREQITATIDRMGDKTAVTYHDESGLISSYTNAKGDKVSYTYATQEQSFNNPDNDEQVSFTFYNLTRIDHPDSTNEQFTYDDRGNMLSWVDQAGKTQTYTHNARGRILTETNPAGGVTSYTYNDDGNLASNKDSDTGENTYSYDSYKRLTKITYADGGSLSISYDLNDRMISTTDGDGDTYTYTYDSNGNLLKQTDPAGNETEYAYDLMDRLVQTTDRLGRISTITYDSMGRVSRMTGADGQDTVVGYDSEGQVTQVKRGGQMWKTSYDAEGAMSSTTSPLGHTTGFQTDSLGLTTAITGPLGNTTSLTRDSLGQLTSKKGPLSQTTYGCEQQGMLSSASVPGIGTARYTYNDLGLVSQITDLNGQNWTLGYTAMGRLEFITDTLGNTWKFSYDNRGRANKIEYPGGDSQVTAYDAAGNPIQSVWSDGTNLHYTYDSLDRLIGADNLDLTRDAEGKVTSTKTTGPAFDATYDNGRKLKTVSYDNGAFTVTYVYDGTTGLLSAVTDNLTGARVDFLYDADTRPTRVVRSNGVNTDYTWDEASNLIRIQHGSIADLQYTMDAGGQVIETAVDVPLDPASVFSSSTEVFSYDAACQVSSNGYIYGKRGRLTAAPGYTFTWDGASRLTGINDVALEYNATGNLISRTEDGRTIQYDYNCAIDMSPIVAERDEATGEALRYYVWSPYGELLYMIDADNGNKVYFYHFDQIGSTLALTNHSGIVTDAYAYDPYGGLLQHDGSNPQPFTFAGEWGVRQEGTGGTLYHMRARYYDSYTGRFLSRDEVWPKLDDVKSLNPYVYAALNPVNSIDPTGNSVLGDLLVEILTVSDYYTRPKRGSVYKFLLSIKRNLKRAKRASDFLANPTGFLARMVGLGGISFKVLNQMYPTVSIGAVSKLGRLATRCRIPAAPFKAIKGMRGFSKVAGRSMILLGGALSLFDMTKWSLATKEKAGQMISQELGYQAVKFAEKSKIAQSGIRFVGRGVNTVAEAMPNNIASHAAGYKLVGIAERSSFIRNYAIRPVGRLVGYIFGSGN